MKLKPNNQLVSKEVNASFAQEPSYSTRDRTDWNQVIEEASDSEVRSAKIYDDAAAADDDNDDDDVVVKMLLLLCDHSLRSTITQLTVKWYVVDVS